MAKFSVNDKCPCGSNLKYKKCCAIFHKGKIASNALELMKSRYSAYVVKDVKYIIKTTDVNNPDFTVETTQWANDIEEFCNNSDFQGLEVINFIDGDDKAYVKFNVKLYINKQDQSFIENSEFKKVNGSWLYVNGEFE